MTILACFEESGRRGTDQAYLKRLAKRKTINCDHSEDNFTVSNEITLCGFIWTDGENPSTQGMRRAVCPFGSRRRVVSGGWLVAKRDVGSRTPRAFPCFRSPKLDC